MLINIGNLNQEQAKGLSDFFFDIGKGLILSGIGFSAIARTLNEKIIIMTSNSLLTILCVVFAISILDRKNIYE